ncbi:MAG TPA: hypothetical protein VM901_03310 [Bdellovibrionota bacterium]|jgi:hypothetical protein|nr:hypothetical protein [Bdellovibrionota bacterium]
MKRFYSLLVFALFLHSTVACSQKVTEPKRAQLAPGKVQRALPVPEEEAPPRPEEVPEEETVLRALPVDEKNYQAVAEAMVGKPAGQVRAGGVYAEWISGGRGFYSPNNRRLYDRFAEASLPKGKSETKSLYYPFGGPDVIYPLAFFPRVTTLVLVGIEPIGTLPSLEVARSPGYQASIKSMMDIYLGSTFYRTQDMREEAKEDPERATWAKMMAAIALLDLKITATSTGTLDELGLWKDDATTPAAKRNPLSPRGVVFYCERGFGKSTEQVSIYYFQQNLGEYDRGALTSLVKATPFRNFMARFRGNYTSFLKAASYLSHDTQTFKTSNELVFGANRILQSPSGVPFSEFVARREAWHLTLFGEYQVPSDTFSEHPQVDLKEAYRGAIREDARAEYADFVSYGGALPFHYDYGTGPGGRDKGAMLFYATRRR